MRLLAGRGTEEKTCAVNILNPVLWPVRSKPSWAHGDLSKPGGSAEASPLQTLSSIYCVWGGHLYASLWPVRLKTSGFLSLLHEKKTTLSSCLPGAGLGTSPVAMGVREKSRGVDTQRSCPRTHRSDSGARTALHSPPNAHYSANPLRQAPPQGQSLPQPKYLNEFKPGGCWERLGAGVVREGITNVRAFA